MRGARMIVAVSCVACALTPAAFAAPAAPDVAYLAVSDGFWQVWVMDHSGGGARQVTRSHDDKARVSWFPDGGRVLVSTNQGDVRVVDVASGREAVLPLGVTPVLDATVSPDGKRIAFSFYGADALDGNDIWLAASDGSGRTRVTEMPVLQHDPVWSVDGRSIYFLSGDGKQAHDIWKIDLGSGSREQLTVADLYHFDVAVSRAGDLAYSGNRSGNYELWYQAVGARPVALTNDPALDARPTFSPDGREVLFESSRGGGMNIWKVDVKTLRTEQVTHHADGARGPVWRAGVRR